MPREFPPGTFDDPRFQTYRDGDLLGRKPERPETIEEFWGTARGVDDPTFRAGPSNATKEHLIRFVRDYCDNLIFTSADLRDDGDLGMVFLPAILGAFTNWEESALKNIGILYEYYSKALPRSVNGRPVFGSMYMLNVADWKKARKAIEREMALRKGLGRRIEEDLEDADSDVAADADGERVRAAGERGGDDPGEGGDDVW